MKRRITDLFKKIFRGKTIIKVEPTITEAPKKAGGLFQPRKKPAPKWLIIHNQFQAHISKKVSKRRKANKVGRKQRQINRKTA